MTRKNPNTLIMWPFLRARSRTSSVQVRIRLLKNNFEKFAMSNINAFNFISRLREYLEMHQSLVNEDTVAKVGAFLQDQCLEALELWEIVLEAGDYPVNYSPQSTPFSSDHSDSFETNEENEAEVADANHDEAEALVNAGTPSGSTRNIEASSTGTIDAQKYINDICHTLQKLTTGANRVNTNQEQKWLRFRVSVLRETAGLFGIHATDYRWWFH